MACLSYTDPRPPVLDKFSERPVLFGARTWRFIPGLGETTKKSGMARMGPRLLFLAAAVIALGGCSYVRSYVADRDMGDVVKFCEKKRANPDIAAVVGKLPIVNVDEITPEMLAIDAMPSETEVEAIRALSRDQRECRDRIDEVAKDHWPTQAATRKELALKFDLVTAELLKRNMSYGNANRLYQEAALVAEGRLTEERKEQMAQARESEAEAWRTIGDTVRAVAGSQKPEPNGDPCTWVDNNVDCRAN